MQFLESPPILAILLGVVLASFSLGLLLRGKHSRVSEYQMYAKIGFLVIFSIAVGISIFTCCVMPLAVPFGVLLSLPFGLLLFCVSGSKEK